MSSTETMQIFRAAGKNVLASPGIGSLTTSTGKSERRCIMRHALGHYRALIITGLYVQQLKDDTTDGIKINTFIPALKYCIAAHPILSAAIRGEETEAPQFVRPATLDLRNHIEICDPPTVGAMSPTDEVHFLKQLTVEKHDQLFQDIEHIPPWKIVVLPLPAQPGTSERRFYILFSFSHSHGDGKSALAFHKTLLKGFEVGYLTYNEDPLHRTSSSPLLPPIEEACNLKISLPYLLGPFIATYLPKFISGILNLHASVTPQVPDSWIGTPAVYDPKNFHTGLEIVVIDKETLNAILAACKTYGAKFTGLLHQVIVRAMSQALPADTPAGNFVAETAVDLRHLIPGLSNDDMALCVSSVYEAFARVDSASSPGGKQSEEDKEAMWAAARSTTARLAAGISTLANQPIGLLQYLAHFRMWLVNQIGKPHDSSYSISNIVSFDPFNGNESKNATTHPKQQRMSWDIEMMVFSQPANPTSTPLCFQVVSRKGGAMTITLTWQIGVLGLPDENSFVKGIGEAVKTRLYSIASEAT
jgi:hypothetical protein